MVGNSSRKSASTPSFMVAVALGQVLQAPTSCT